MRNFTQLTEESIVFVGKMKECGVSSLLKNLLYIDSHKTNKTNGENYLSKLSLEYPFMIPRLELLMNETISSLSDVAGISASIIARA